VFLSTVKATKTDTSKLSSEVGIHRSGLRVDMIRDQASTHVAPADSYSARYASVTSK